jgi:hypothetical protein
LIDLIVNHSSIAYNKPREYWREMEHADVIVGTGHAKEKVSSPEIM